MHATGKYLPLECIDKELECDGKLDCEDGFDEDDCPTTCPQYIYQDSKLLAPVVCFHEQVLTGVWAAWVEQHAPYTKDV